MKNVLWIFCLAIFVFGASATAQVRPVEKEEPKKEEPKQEKTTDEKGEKVEVKPKAGINLPDTFKVKYQGGLFGFSKKQNGFLKCDDINERLIFLGKDKKEKFSIPYKAILVIYPSRKKVRAGSGRVIGAAPVMGAGILGSLMKKKVRYLIVQFRDPDIEAEGRANFRVASGELLSSAINSIGRRAEMKQRGDAYMRGKDY